MSPVGGASWASLRRLLPRPWGGLPRGSTRFAHSPTHRLRFNGPERAGPGAGSGGHHAVAGESKRRARLTLGGTEVLWILALVLIGAAGGYLLSYQARHFSSTFSKVEADKRSLLEAGRQMEAQLRTLESERGTLSQSTQTLAVDRDNLLAQTKRLMDSAAERDAVATLHERVLKRTAEENRALKERFMPLEEEFAALQEHHDTLRREFEVLEQQLYAAQQHGAEKRLKEELEQERKKREEDLAALRQTRGRIKELETVQVKVRTELSKTQERFGALQERYTGILSDNRSLAVRAKKVPTEVTTLAREHERLVKDLADTHYNMGVIFAKNQEYVRAAKEFEMVVELRPDDADAHYNLGLIYAEHIPDRNKAMGFFRRYLDINPGASDATWVRQYIASWKAWAANESLEP